MAIITVATSKGGAGKTTIARVLLGHAAQNGHKVAALDTDLNHSLADWIAHDSKIPMTSRIELDELQVLPAVEALTAAHDFVVIDTPGAASRAAMFAIGCADLVLVPCKLSAADVVEAVKTMRLIDGTAQVAGRAINARVLLTGYKPRTQVAQHVENQIRAAKLPMLETRLHDLVAFEGMSFSGIVPATGYAGIQAQELFDEVAALLPKERRNRRAA